MEQLITIQKREKLNNVYVCDEKSHGGANHHYLISVDRGLAQPQEVHLFFQCGARGENTSQEGIIDTDLLEVVKHRLEGFQQGSFATELNAKALEHIEIALMYMNRRVEDRIERQVLGLNKK